MEKVPGYNNRRGREPPATPPAATGKSPVFVVRTGRPAPEIIRTDKERAANGEQGNKDAEFQESVQLESCKEINNSEIIGDLNGKSTELEGDQSAADIFEERLAEIDKDLKRYDQELNTDAKNIGATEGENFLESLSLIIDQPVHTQPSRAQQHPILRPLSRAPLSAIVENNVKNLQRGATWKRLNRTEGVTDTVMEDIVGEKRGSNCEDDQFELLKKRKVSQMDRWLPRKYSPRVLSPRPDDVTIAKVCSLINADQKQWKTEALENSLLGFEAEIIRTIPLCRTEQPDVLTWPYNPRGEYTLHYWATSCAPEPFGENRRWGWFDSGMPRVL
nr:hypothetical protein CFP56_62804 [Quercus suber]